MSESTDRQAMPEGKSGACDMCRKRKSKCNMIKPSCSVCVDHEWRCTYSLRNKKPGPRKGSKQQHRLNMQRRLSRIESLLHPGIPDESIPAPTDPDSQHGTPYQPFPSPGVQPAPSIDSERSQSNTSSPPDELQPIADAINWTLCLKHVECRAELHGGHNQTFSNQLELSPEAEHRLLSLFFDFVVLPVPIFSKLKFYKDYEAGCIPRFLLNAIFALSSRFSTSSELSRVGSEDPKVMGQNFSRRAVVELEHATKGSRAIAMNEVKTAYLLAYYLYTNLLFREGSEQCSRTIRMAYMIRLHQIDNPHADISGSAAEKEEKRSVWWAIYALDCFSSLVSFIPSGIDELSLATSVPEILLSESSAAGSPPSIGFRPVSDFVDWSRCILKSGSSLGAKLQATIIFSHSLAREASHLRRLTQENPLYKLDDRMKSFQHKWNSMFAILPSWVIHPSRHELDVNEDSHRQRIEMLKITYITGAMASAPPLCMDLHWPMEQPQNGSTTEGSWKACISYALKIVTAHRECPSEYLEKADAITLPITWAAGLLLTLQLMNKSLVDSTEKIALMDAVDTLMISLKKTSRHWGIAEVLLRSLEGIRGKTWIKLDLQEILQCSLRVWSPLGSDMSSSTETTPKTPIINAPVNITVDNDIEGLMDMMDMAALPWPPGELLSTIDWLGDVQHIVPSFE